MKVLVSQANARKEEGNWWQEEIIQDARGGKTEGGHWECKQCLKIVRIHQTQEKDIRKGLSSGQLIECYKYFCLLSLPEVKKLPKVAVFEP